jgi:hypothetical protein
MVLSLSRARSLSLALSRTHTLERAAAQGVLHQRCATNLLGTRGHLRILDCRPTGAQIVP